MFSNLNFPVNQDNFGGVDRFWFIPERDIDYVDASKQVVLKEGKAWYLGKATKYSINFKNPSRDARGGTTFRPRLTGTVKRHSPEMEALLSYMRGKRYVVIYKDKNGYLNQVGTKGQALVFETDQDSGTSPDTSNAVSFNFSGDTKLPPVHYIRELVVSEDPGAEVPVVDPVLVYINGNLVGTRQPGEIVDIKSEFTLEFDLL